MPTSHRFPEDFLWGAATSAYQIEGSPTADGAGPSIWHRFTRIPGAIHNGDTGDVACDHYHRYREDVALMAELGLNAYRFSISWSRVLPAGRGAVNQKGLGFYDRLVDALLERGIQPSATLFHWDLPVLLDDEGGWLNRDSAAWFADYADVVVRRLGDRVAMWATLNEPWVVVDGGYLTGVLAPGHHSTAEVAPASHNLLRAHGMGLDAIRAAGGRQAGLVVNIEPKYAASDSEADRAATARADAYLNRQYLDPVFFGRYPDEMKAMFGAEWPVFPEADFELIRRPVDFIGINYYTRAVVRDDPAAPPVRAAKIPQTDQPHSATDWEVYPAGLTDVLTWFEARYGPMPVYVTENGVALHEPATVDGPLLADPFRVDYLRQHLLGVRAAMEAGVPVRGYFAWSLLDNFEWAHGYSKRFGLFHVDFATQKRTWKASAGFYSRVIQSHGEALAT